MDIIDIEHAIKELSRKMEDIQERVNNLSERLDEIDGQNPNRIAPKDRIVDLEHQVQCLKNELNRIKRLVKPETRFADPCGGYSE